MTAPAVGGFAFARDSLPSIGTTAERGTRFPSPPGGFKVFNRETNTLQEYGAGGWTDIATGALIGGSLNLSGSITTAGAATFGGPVTGDFQNVQDVRHIVSPWDKAYNPSGIDLTNAGSDPGTVANILEAAMQSAVNIGGICSLRDSRYPDGIFRVNRQLVISGDVIRIDGSGGSAHSVGTRIEWQAGSASWGLLLQSATGASGNGSCPSGYLRCVTLSKTSLSAKKAGDAGLTLNGLRQFKVDQVTPRNFDIGFDLTNNSFGCSFHDCRVVQGEANCALYLRTGPQSGNDISFYDCWFAGKYTAACIAGGSTNFHFIGGQFSAGTGLSADEDNYGVVTLCWDWLTDATAAMGNVQLRGMDFENWHRTWAIRSHNSVDLEVAGVSFLATDATSNMAIGLHKGTALNNANMQWVGCNRLGGSFSAAAIFSEAGASSTYQRFELPWRSTASTVAGVGQSAGWFTTIMEHISSTTGVAFKTLGSAMYLLLDGVRISAGTGTPEGATVGSPGDLRFRTNGGAATSLYVKETGSNTNTGWVAK